MSKQFWLKTIQTFPKTKDWIGPPPRHATSCALERADSTERVTGRVDEGKRVESCRTILFVIEQVVEYRRFHPCVTETTVDVISCMDEFEFRKNMRGEAEGPATVGSTRSYQSIAYTIITKFHYDRDSPQKSTTFNVNC